jgi:hypothetical protein
MVVNQRNNQFVGRFWESFYKTRHFFSNIFFDRLLLLRSDFVTMPLKFPYSLPLVIEMSNVALRSAPLLARPA